MTKIKLMRDVPRFLFTGAFLFLLCMLSLFNSQEALGQIYLDYDTMYVQSDSAFPGDVVWLTISITNTVKISGFSGVFTYDTLILAPDYIIVTFDPGGGAPPETAWDAIMERTERTEVLFSDGAYWSAAVLNRDLDSTSFFSWVGFDRPVLPPDTGAVARIKFKVRQNAQEGATSYLRWCPSAAGNTDANNWADSTGEITYVPKTQDGTFKVRSGGGPPNQYPVFVSMPTYREVNQGATLQFDVTAYDPDGDSLTLWVDPLDLQFDEIYDFPAVDGDSVVSQTFTFSPTFADGPGTISVKFMAEDRRGYLTTQTVSIEIIETAQDYLIASSEQGGVPGSSGRMVPFVITNSIPIYGFQFTLRWDASVVDVDSFVKSDVTSDFTLWTNLPDSSGVATVLIASLQSHTIPAGIETVLYAALSVHEDAPPGEVELQLEDAVESIDPELPSQPLGVFRGIFTVDLFGDAIIDRVVNIADVVGVVAYILDNIEFDARQFLAADVTKNDTVNVADLVGIVNIILNRWTGPSPSSYFGPAAIVRLDYEDLEPGTAGEVKVLADLEVPVAAGQIRIDYDPEQLSFEAPRLSAWSDKFIAEYRDDKQGKLIVVLYSMSNDPISPGEGNILSLPVEVSPDVVDKINLQIGEIVLADENAVQIPVDDGRTLVPQAFELSQNYPNPFNPTTTIKFTLPARGDGGATLPATLKIYNVLGEMVRTLVDEPMSPGVHQRLWDGKDGQGNEVASGVYFYRLKAGEYSETKKMVLLK